MTLKPKPRKTKVTKDLKDLKTNREKFRVSKDLKDLNLQNWGLCKKFSNNCRF